MSVFRVEKQKNYTVMSNVHLQDRTLSLKAKGLLSLMLSLPEDWDYTLRGLAAINKESVNTIAGIVKELIGAGYIVRGQSRQDSGKFSHAEYIIYETPQPLKEGENSLEIEETMEERVQTESLKVPEEEENTYPAEEIRDSLDNSDAAQVLSAGENEIHLTSIQESRSEQSLDFSGLSPCHKKRDTVKRDTVFCDTNKIRNNKIHNKQNTNNSSIPSIVQRIKDQIGYEDLIVMEPNHKEMVDGIVDIITDVIISPKETLQVGGEQKPAGVVKARFAKLGLEDISYVLLTMSENTTQIRNIMAYLRTTLYNATTTRGMYYQTRINHDLYGKPPDPAKESG